MNLEQAKKQYQHYKKLLKRWEKEYKSMTMSSTKSRLYYLISDLEDEMRGMRWQFGESNLLEKGGNYD